MEDLEERARRGETRKFYRVPSKGVTASSRRIAEAVDDEHWQRVRHSMKGTSTQSKIETLQFYFATTSHGHYVMGDEAVKMDVADCDVCIRVNNYFGALTRGGQLKAGTNLVTAVENDWNLSEYIQK